MEYALSELFTLQMGKTPSRDNSSYWKKSENNWISIADLTNSGKYISNTKETLSDSAVAESGIKKIPANTVIMSFKLSLGKVAITEKEMYSNEAIMAFIDKGVEKISPEYLYYLLRAKDWSKGTNKAVMGATLNKATWSRFFVTHPFGFNRQSPNISTNRALISSSSLVSCCFLKSMLDDTRLSIFTISS